MTRMEYWSTQLPQLPLLSYHLPGIIVQWMHSIVELPKLPKLPVTWTCNLTAYPHILIDRSNWIHPRDESFL